MLLLIFSHLRISDVASRVRAIEVNDVFQISLNDKVPHSLSMS